MHFVHFMRIAERVCRQLLPLNVQKYRSTALCHSLARLALLIVMHIINVVLKARLLAQLVKSLHTRKTQARIDSLGRRMHRAMYVKE